MIANVELMDMGDNGWLIFRIYKSKGVKKCDLIHIIRNKDKVLEGVEILSGAMIETTSNV